MDGSQQPQKEWGFTLVELSIVLVIIGLLIGGILIAQSMISTSKIQGFVRQIQQFDVAIENFKTKYNTIPGDFTLLTPAGNGDHILTGNPSCPNSPPLCFDNEFAGFWVQLNQSGFDANNHYSATIDNSHPFNSSKTSPNAPTSVLGDNYPAFMPFRGSDGKISAYRIATYPNYTDATQNWSLNGVCFNSKDAFAVDNKIDDGKPLNGRLMMLHVDNSACDISTSQQCYMMSNISISTKTSDDPNIECCYQ